MRDVILYVCFVVLVLTVLAMLRNLVTFKVRMAILHTRTPENEFAGNALHDLLPSYEQMLFRPAYWLKWTESDWREYIARQEGAAS